jgi:hypothetical protein
MPAELHVHLLNWHVHLGFADVRAAEGIAFVLGHALAMKAIQGGKAKNDKLDSHKTSAWCAAAC